MKQKIRVLYTKDCQDLFTDFDYDTRHLWIAIDLFMQGKILREYLHLPL